MYQIKEAVKRLKAYNVSAFNLRDYEKVGIVTPARKQCGKSRYRVYSDEDLERVIEYKKAQKKYRSFFKYEIRNRLYRLEKEKG